MTVSVKLKIDDLPRAIASKSEAVRREFANGVRIGAIRGKTYLIQRTPVNLGQMKAAWEVVEAPPATVRLVNSAPYAGIVESGARPHNVNRAGIEGLTRWAQRKLGLSEKEARGVAFAVAQKLKREGQKPTYFVRAAIPELLKLVRAEVAKRMKAVEGSKR